MTKWQQLKLGEIATFVNGYAFKPSDWNDIGIPIIRIQNLTNDNASRNYYNGQLDEKYRVVRGDILISWSATIGVFEWTREDSYLNQHIFKVVFNKLKVNKSFFKYLIKQKINEMLAKVHGSTMKHITKSNFDNIPILLPDIKEQDRIARILDKAEEIRTKKKLANEKLDEFLKSTFIDMFGDPMSNNINIKKEKLGKYLVYVQNGISRRRKIPQNIGNLVFRIKEIRENYIDYSDINRIPLNEKEKDKYKINNNELLFIRVNGNKDYVGRNAVFRGYIEDAYFNDHIMRVKIEERYMNPIYLSRFLNMSFGKEEIRKYIKTSAGQYTINQQGLSSVELTIPPIEQQNQFAQIVQKVEAQKENNQEIIEQMDNLFNSLMQQAFNSGL